MLKNRSFVEVLAFSTVLFCIWAPACLWVYYSIREGKLVDFPGSLTGFMAAANTITLGLLGLQQFQAKKVAT